MHIFLLVHNAYLFTCSIFCRYFSILLTIFVQHKLQEIAYHRSGQIMVGRRNRLQALVLKKVEVKLKRYKVLARSFDIKLKVPDDQSRLLLQVNNQSDNMINKAMDSAGMKVLSPIRLNEKHVNVSGSNSPGTTVTTDPGRVLVQHQKSGMAQTTEAPQNGAQPHNRRQYMIEPEQTSRVPNNQPVEARDLHLPNLRNTALSGLPVPGVVTSHPAHVRPGLLSVVRPGLSLASNTVSPGVSVASLQMEPGGFSPQATVRPCCSCAQCPMAGTPRGPRPAQPSTLRPLRPPFPSPASSAAVNPEVIDLSDDEEAPAPIKSATLDKLRACGISVSKQKVPQIPSNVRLPPGISLSVSSDSCSKRSSVSSGDGDGANKRVALDNNVASAITAVGGSSNEPKLRVELELSDKQMNVVRALGLL